MGILEGSIKESNYENIDVICPHCNQEIRYNRASDLKEVKPISGKNVNCLRPECGQQFRIVGDLANPAFEMLIYDCYKLREEKRYCNCILNFTQAFEIFFSNFLKANLLFKPFAQDRDITKLNEVAKLLYDTTKEYTYKPLRNLFFNRVLTAQELTSLNEAIPIIQNFTTLRRTPPTDEAINLYPDSKIKEILKRLKSSEIAEIRNKVVHKSAYRPTLEEVESAFKETKDILYSLGHLLHVRYDNVHWYLMI